MTAAGDQLGRYRLEELLGTGGMATVWEARDSRLDRRVAIKVISDSLAADPGFVKRFRREAKTAAGLSHPNLVTVFDFNADPPPPYLVMEHIDGGTLAERLRGGRPIDAERLARELLDALDHIHRAGVIHRDIKPANVLIDSAGHSRLTDFGIARPRDATALTGSGNVLGTLAYMAPELRSGAEADERSDLYSAGVLLGEVAEGGDGGSVRALAARLSASDPQGRPASAREALELLDRGARDEEGPTAPMLPPTERRPREPTAPTRRAERTGGTPGRRPAALALGALALVALAIALFSGGGDGDGGGGSGGDSDGRAATDAGATPGAAGTAAGGTDGGGASESAESDLPDRGAAPAPAPEQSVAPAASSAADSCEALQQQADSLPGPGAGGGSDKEAKDQIKEQEKELKEQLKACGEGGKPPQ